jgi:cobalt-precorrin 5A hydrolase/precorrin-3B C17-methyltransferase
MKIAIVVLNRRGLDLARRLQHKLHGAVVHGLTGRTDGADLPFSDTIAHLRGLFADGTAIMNRR